MLAALSNMPRNEDDWNRWSFHHRTSHDLIRSAIHQQHQIKLSDFIVDPVILGESPAWLENNQQMHTAMNGVLGKQSADLEDLKFEDQRQLQAWIYLHYQEHVTAENTLGIRS